MRSASNFALFLRPFAPQFATWIDRSGQPDMPIKRVIDKIDANMRPWVRLLVAQHPDMDVQARWFDMLDEIELEINAARTTLVTNRVARITDQHAWASTYNQAHGEYLVAADRIWSARKSLWAGEVTEWLESI